MSNVTKAQPWGTAIPSSKESLVTIRSSGPTYRLGRVGQQGQRGSVSGSQH